MDLFGCLLAPFSRLASASHGAGDERRQTLEKLPSDASDGSDLLGDEGASCQRDLWQLVLRQKLLDTRQRVTPIDIQVSGSSTAETFVQSLTVLYNENGFAQRMPRIREIFSNMEPFVVTIDTMAQASMVVSLVWGSLALVFQSVLRFADLFDDTSRMLYELSKTLPRFRAYAEIFHTPRLHQALREVYEIYISFCFKISEVLQSNKCHTLMRGKWAGFHDEYNRTKAQLKFTSSEFEKEARLADVQESSRRHNEILSKLGSMSSSGGSVRQDFVTNIGLPRNERFTGRDEVLALLHAKLEPSFQEDAALRCCSSCLVHAIGGMGKTEIALEYTYRYRPCYSHVFWLRAQSNTVLLESFLDIVRKLRLDEEGANPEKRVQVGLEWFQSTASKWLLIFDNAEETSTIKRFWPASNSGAIIVTSQNPLLAQNTKFGIHLQPMPPEEGSALIQGYLNRGRSEIEAAQSLSKSLGGLPLAIAHFAGYVARSQCPLDQILKNLDRRIKSSQVWKTEGLLSSNVYELTLNTVWDLAFNRLSTDSRKLLEFLAFLDPDQVPVEMFIGPSPALELAYWHYWDVEKFDAAIGTLRERHLVERYKLPTGDYLRTHRALQRAILQELDTDLAKRQSVFDEVVSIARTSFPAANIITRGDTSQYAQSAKFMPQVINIYNTFMQSDPALENRLEFARLLSDVGYYGVNNASQAEALDLLQAGEAICTSLLGSRPSEARPILGDILGPLQVLIQYLGVDGRRRALGMNSRAISNREEEMAGIPCDKWEQLGLVNMARAHNDMGVSLSQLNRVDEASQWFDSALKYYTLAGNEETLTSRFGHIYSFQLLPLCTKQKAAEARELAQRSMDLVAKAVGVDSPLSLQTKFLVGMVLFTTGSMDEALQLHEEVFEKRRMRQGSSNHLTLGSQYNLAVCCHNLNDLEKAEDLLKDILANSCVTMLWRNEDVLRTRYRLSLVLRARNRLEESAVIQQEIFADLEIARQVSSKLITSQLGSTKPGYSDEDDMKILDFGVPIFHGRTAGLWSNGIYW